MTGVRSSLRRAIRAALCAAIAAGIAGAAPLRAEPREPPPGSALRAALLDTIRPFAEYDLAPPVTFVVIEMLAEGDLAFARLTAQRPGGVPIDMAQTPMVTRRHHDPSMIDGPRFEVFFARTAGRWYVRDYALGATDAWWFGYDCATYARFLPEQAC